QIAGYAATNNNSKAEALFSQRASWHRFRSALAIAFTLRPELKSLATDETLLCRCEDVTFGRVRQFNDWRDAKLQPRCGIGASQGRICGAATKYILGWGMESVRPPVLPALVGSLISAGPARAEGSLGRAATEPSQPAQPAEPQKTENIEKSPGDPTATIPSL